ncbi:acylphosphatase [Providencia stuartii]|nr:acylphosphatase [Providencia stuartii MRSN 2154]AMG66556.1 acylphosphatase [Providencia stuartii]EDU58623.1 acylphosphatase [Providencia stuartii ATCC 25827]QPN39386.1 acylphosphatase [Providencia sp. 2.29]APG53031.1 acylphosphatase [Providencia stuartii]
MGAKMTTSTGRLFYIYGRVQGVGFRYQTYHWANQNGIKGYVYNREDGSVALGIYGSDQDIRFVEEWLNAGGPPGAKIDHYFSENWHTEKIADFSVRY